MPGLVAFNEECARAAPHRECTLTPLLYNETSVGLFILEGPSEVGQFDGSNGAILVKPNLKIKQGPKLGSAGSYTDDMVKQDGTWLFRYRKIDRFIHDKA